MDSMTLFIASLAVSCIGALASVLLIKADNAAKTAGCLIGAVAAVLSFVAGIQAVLGDVTSVDTIVFFPFANFQLLLNQLSGLFVALTGWLPGAPISGQQWKLLKAGNAASDNLPGLKELGVSARPLGLFLDRWLVRFRKHGRFGN